jgi:hypothetical protein
VVWSEAAASYLAAVGPRLQSEGYELTTVAADGLDVKVARRRRFEASKFGVAENVFGLAELASADAEAIRSFSATCFRLATQGSGSTVPRALGRAVFCYAVALVHGLDEAIAAEIRSKAPAKHWAANEIPVAVDLDRKEVLYFEKTPLWGAAYYRGFRKTIRSLLVP